MPGLAGRPCGLAAYHWGKDVAKEGCHLMTERDKEEEPRVPKFHFGHVSSEPYLPVGHNASS